MTLITNVRPVHAYVNYVQKAETCIRAALHQEDLAIKYIREGRLNNHAGEAIRNHAISAAKVDLQCAATAARKAALPDNGEISSDTGLATRSDLSLAEEFDSYADTFLLHGDNGKAIDDLERAARLKTSALGELTPAAAPTTTTSIPIASDSLNSPVGSGPIQLTDVKCYLGGTAGNPERDATFLVNGVTWYFQQVFPASLVPGGSAASPIVFIENMPTPYNEPGIAIYATFGVTVSGDVSAVSSGQQVIVNGSLVDLQGNPVTPGYLTVKVTCP